MMGILAAGVLSVPGRSGIAGGVRFYSHLIGASSEKFVCIPKIIEEPIFV